MSLKFVFDEHLRGPEWQAVLRHNASSEFSIDVVRVGDSPDLPLGIEDPDLLVWTEEADRILVTRDKTTVPRHLAAHLASGRECPGIFMIRPHARFARVLEMLVLAAWVSEPHDWRSRIEFVG